LIIPDSASAYDQLADSLKPYDIVPLFRVDHGPANDPARSEETRSQADAAFPINIALFILTVLSVMFVGAQTQVPPTSPGHPGTDCLLFGDPAQRLAVCLELVIHFGSARVWPLLHEPPS